MEKVIEIFLKAPPKEISLVEAESKLILLHFHEETGMVQEINDISEEDNISIDELIEVDYIEEHEPHIDKGLGDELTDTDLEEFDNLFFDDMDFG